MRSHRSRRPAWWPGRSPRQAAAGNKTGSSAASGGVALGSVPPPEKLGPVGAYLASDEFSWCSGQVIYSVGSEVAVVGAPHLLEVARIDDVDSLPHALAELVPKAFVPAEAAQASNGGGTPRFGEIFGEAATGTDRASAKCDRCVIVTDDAGWGGAVSDALVGAGSRVHRRGRRRHRDRVRGNRRAVRTYRPRALARSTPWWSPSLARARPARAALRAETHGSRSSMSMRGSPTHPYRRLVGSCGYGLFGGDRPTVRVVTVTNANSAGGRSRAQAAAQLARSAHSATSDRVDAFSISVETRRGRPTSGPIAEVIAHLVSSADSRRAVGRGVGRRVRVVRLAQSPEPGRHDHVRWTGGPRLARRRAAWRRQWHVALEPAS